jgi:prevent-host-death family protein
MRRWAVQDAKARFGEMLGTCLAEGPQLVTRRGAEAAVLVPVAAWRRLQAGGRRSLKALLRRGAARADLEIPPRGHWRSRPGVTFGQVFRVFLPGTNVVSELRRARPHGGVVAWLANVPESDTKRLGG